MFDYSEIELIFLGLVSYCNNLEHILCSEYLSKSCLKKYEAELLCVKNLLDKVIKLKLEQFKKYKIESGEN